MFTGIIETTGNVFSVLKEQTNFHFEIKSSISRCLKPGQSVSHDGVCMTITKAEKKSHRVTAVNETINKTNLSDWKPWTIVNLERCVKAYDRIDGHFVQGHVDGTGKCLNIIKLAGSWEFLFSYSPQFSNLLVEKGSVCINGVSLTVARLTKRCLTVCIIPHTFQHTNFHCIKKGAYVNIEYDILGKYISRILLKK